eukprot:1518515-Pyramimonas_sp.AAC.1
MIKNSSELVCVTVRAYVRRAPVCRSGSRCPPAHSRALAFTGMGLASVRILTFLSRNTKRDGRKRLLSFSFRACWDSASESLPLNRTSSTLPSAQRWPSRKVACAPRLVSEPLALGSSTAKHCAGSLSSVMLTAQGCPACRAACRPAILRAASSCGRPCTCPGGGVEIGVGDGGGASDCSGGGSSA